MNPCNFCGNFWTFEFEKPLETQVRFPVTKKVRTVKIRTFDPFPSFFTCSVGTRTPHLHRRKKQREHEKVRNSQVHRHRKSKQGLQWSTRSCLIKVYSLLNGRNWGTSLLQKIKLGQWDFLFVFSALQC